MKLWMDKQLLPFLHFTNIISINYSLLRKKTIVLVVDVGTQKQKRSPTQNTKGTWLSFPNLTYVLPPIWGVLIHHHTCSRDGLRNACVRLRSSLLRWSCKQIDAITSYLEWWVVISLRIWFWNPQSLCCLNFILHLKIMLKRAAVLHTEMAKHAHSILSFTQNSFNQ